MVEESPLAHRHDAVPGAPGSAAQSPDERFIELVVRHQHDLTRFIRALGIRGDDLDEVLQQSMIVIWSKWAEFDLSREFLPWALKCAHLEVLKHRQRRSSDRHLFSDDTLEAIASHAQKDLTLYDIRIDALRGCLQRLRPADHDLLIAKYGLSESATEIAGRLKTTVKSVYRRLDRLRAALSECARQRMIQSGC